MKTKRATIGIVGGLCPLATADIYLKAMKQTRDVRDDADYPDIVISVAIEQEQRGNRFDDRQGRYYDMSHRVLYIYQVARELKARGVSRILVPDFLSYSSAAAISENIQAPLVDIVGALVAAVKRQWPDASTVGLLTTTMAIDAKIFEKKFADQGLRIIYPDAGPPRDAVMEAVYGDAGVKRGVFHGKPGELVRLASENLLAKGADVIVSAITELPLVERRYYPENNYLDCNEVIARELVDKTGDIRAASETRRVIGVLGGLGPAATVDIFDKIVRRTPAGRDQDHIKIVIENNPRIPDRTAALRAGEESPGVAMLATAEKLQAAGVDFIIVPCNTAHAFLRTVRDHIGVPILDMIEETARYIATRYPSVRRVGLLATSGTLFSKVYEAPLREKDIVLLVPPPDAQESLVMEAIYGKEGIKAGQTGGLPRDLLRKAVAGLVRSGAELIIMGCTEIPLALKGENGDVPFIDPTDILAQVAVERAMGPRDADA